MPLARSFAQRLLVLTAAVGLTAVALMGARPAVAAAGCSTTTPALGATVTCTSAGAEIITVPTGTGSVVIVALGAGGGGGGHGSATTVPAGNGGAGAKVEATVPLVGATSLSITVGSAGSGGSTGAASGGVGGGLSAVVNGSTHLVIAGGGGGGGGETNGSAGGAGGAGGQTGSAGGGFGGGGGNVTAAGAGGAAGSGYTPGTAGTSGMAGAGGVAGRPGGGGGAGYGGGGGGGFTAGSSPGGGGGGGSYAIGTATSTTFTSGGGGAGGTGAQSNSIGSTAGQAGSITLTFVADPSPGTPTAPGAPSAVVGTPTSGTVALSWAVPEFNGLSAITGYKIEKNDGSTWSTVIADTASTSLSYTVTGLTNGTAYTFRVSAINGIGTSVASVASVAITPGTLPGAPTSVTAQPSQTSAVVSWLAPASDGQSPIIGYKIEQELYSSWSTIVANTGSTSLSYTKTGLTEGTPYKWRVTAINQVGAGSASAASIQYTPGVIPGAPSSITATAGTGQVSLTWGSVPFSPYLSPVTGYKVEKNDGSTWTVAVADTASTTRSATMTGLTNGVTYTFRVSAINQIGTGSPSSVSSAVTPTGVPQSPTNLTATAGDSQVMLAWTAPTNDGGSAITGYEVEANDGVAWSTVIVDTASVATTYTATGLTNGASYMFRVSAINALGTSNASAVSASVTPVAPAPAPAPSPAPAPAPSASTGSTTPSVSTPATAPVPSPESAPIPAPVTAPTTRPVAGSVSAVTGEVVAVTVPVRASSAVTTSLRGAPRAEAKVGEVVRVGVSGVPASSRLSVAIKVDGKWRSLGTARSGARGRATLPAFTSDAPGTFPMRITTLGEPTRYVQVVIANH